MSRTVHMSTLVIAIFNFSLSWADTYAPPGIVNETTWVVQKSTCDKGLTLLESGYEIVFSHRILGTYVDQQWDQINFIKSYPFSLEPDPNQLIAHCDLNYQVDRSRIASKTLADGTYFEIASTWRRYRSNECYYKNGELADRLSELDYEQGNEHSGEIKIRIKNDEMTIDWDNTKADQGNFVFCLGPAHVELKRKIPVK